MSVLVRATDWVAAAMEIPLPVPVVGTSIVNSVPLLFTEATFAPGGIFVPETIIPGTRPAVDVTVMVLVPLFEPLASVAPPGTVKRTRGTATVAVTALLNTNVVGPVTAATVVDVGTFVPVAA